MSKVKKSIKYIFWGNLFSKGISFIGSILLAKILFPTDYAYLLEASIITGFIQMFGNVGFENFYLQEKIKDVYQKEKILNITAKLRFIVNTALFIIQFIISFIIEYYYQKPILGKMVRIFSFIIILNAITQINMYILRKDMDFKPETLANISRNISATFFKILFAYMGYGPLSFALGALIGNFIRMLVFLKHKFYIPDFKDYDKEILNKIIFFGKHSFFVGILTYGNNQIDKIFFSKFFPKKEVGYYSFSNQYASMPYTYIALPFSSIILSYSANLKNKPKELFSKLISVNKILITTLFPVLIIVLFYAYDLFHLVFGTKWDAAIPIFKILFVYYFVMYVIAFPYSGLLTAYGKPNYISRISFFRLISMLIILPLFHYFDNSAINFVKLYTITGVIFYWLKSSIGLKLLKYNLIDIFFNLKREMISIISIITLLFYLNNYFPSQTFIFIPLILVFFLIINLNNLKLIYKVLK